MTWDPDDPQATQGLQNRWISSLLEPLRERIAEEADSLVPTPEGGETPDSSGSYLLCRAWISRQLEDALHVLTAHYIAEAEARGVQKQTVARLTGHTDSSHMKRKYPSLENFRNARIAADLTGNEIDVVSDGWRFIIHPRTGEAADRGGDS